MTAFWDQKILESTEVIKKKGIAGLEEFEIKLIDEINLLVNDQDFPEDVRLKIQITIGTHRVFQNPQAAKKAEILQYSLLINRLHEDYHELARRQHKTRWGILTDDPEEDMKQKLDWLEKNPTKY